jgi:hypothetical protein
LCFSTQPVRNRGSSNKGFKEDGNPRGEGELSCCQYCLCLCHIRVSDSTFCLTSRAGSQLLLKIDAE